MNKNHKLNNPFIIVSIVLFVLSLTQKSYCTTSNCADSFLVFLLGGFAVFTGGAGLTWLANPFLIATWFTFKRKLKTAMWLSVAATLIALSFLLFDTVLANEAGHNQQITAYKPGYVLWVLSCATMLAGTFMGMLKHNREKAGLQ
jgi:hypothetical protein